MNKYFLKVIFYHDERLETLLIQNRKGGPSVLLIRDMVYWSGLVDYATKEYIYGK